jgi:hypothetical protein
MLLYTDSKDKRRLQHKVSATNFSPSDCLVCLSRFPRGCVCSVVFRLLTKQILYSIISNSNFSCHEIGVLSKGKGKDGLCV